MKNIELFSLVFRQTHMSRFLWGFLIFFLIACGLIWMTDPSITTYWDALWFGFMLVTTIGFGDYTVTFWVSRLIAALLASYGILLSGFICGVGATYLFEKVRMGHEETVSEMVWQLEHLDKLSDDQIQKLKTKIQKSKSDENDPNKNNKQKNA
ncbi:potassium channel family protein [Ileibacterium valens]|uniref:potassium channel family protein n=1 Tax=Ileibacterium valens TaxID=1862668 RepID=UPI0024BA2116|nr:potassium channel family protein [Ileibacterium valens]